MDTFPTVYSWPSSPGSSDSVRYPCAIVPPKGPPAARCGSTCNHWWSSVASANWSMRACSTVTHSEGPKVSPFAAANSAMEWKVLIAASVHQPERLGRATADGLLEDRHLPLLHVAAQQLHGTVVLHLEEVRRDGLAQPQPGALVLVHDDSHLPLLRWPAASGRPGDLKVFNLY